MQAATADRLLKRFKSAACCSHVGNRCLCYAAGAAHYTSCTYPSDFDTVLNNARNRSPTTRHHQIDILQKRIRLPRARNHRGAWALSRMTNLRPGVRANCVGLREAERIISPLSISSPAESTVRQRTEFWRWRNRSDRKDSFTLRWSGGAPHSLVHIRSIIRSVAAVI